MKVLGDYWQKITSALMVAAIISLVTWVLPGGWGTVWSGIKTVVKWLGESGSLPHWLIIILWICAAVVAGLLVFVLAFKIRETAESIYPTEKTLYGIRWRWKVTKNGIQGLHSFCPVCDFQVHPHHTGMLGEIFATHYECDNPECGRLRETFQGKRNAEVESLVIRKLHQEFRAKNRQTEPDEA